MKLNFLVAAGDIHTRAKNFYSFYTKNKNNSFKNDVNF